MATASWSLPRRAAADEADQERARRPRSAIRPGIPGSAGRSTAAGGPSLAARPSPARSTQRVVLPSTITPCCRSRSRASIERMPPVPPLCQVISRFWNSVICQASPIWPLSDSASGSSAAIPGAWFVSTAQVKQGHVGGGRPGRGAGGQVRLAVPVGRPPAVVLVSADRAGRDVGLGGGEGGGGHPQRGEQPFADQGGPVRGTSRAGFGVAEQGHAQVGVRVLALVLQLDGLGGLDQLGDGDVVGVRRCRGRPAGRAGRMCGDRRQAGAVGGQLEQGDVPGRGAGQLGQVLRQPVLHAISPRCTASASSMPVKVLVIEPISYGVCGVGWRRPRLSPGRRR